MPTASTKIERPARIGESIAPARADFVDGLRALCALFVVEHHIFFELFESKQWELIDPAARAITGWLRYGYISVAGFIVLSGFCLMLPVVSSASTHLHGGVRGFLARRAKRILPPYYAALALSILLLLFVPQFNSPSGFHWDWSLPAFKRGALISHLLLVHNFNPQWMTKINHPLWSIAIEWQIYFVFALILMPLRRKATVVGTSVLAFAIGLVPGLVFHVLDWTRPWYVSLFALGMIAATVGRSKHKCAVFLRSKIPWGMLATVFAVAEIFIASSGFSETANEFATAVSLMCCLIWGIAYNQNSQVRNPGKHVYGGLSSSLLVGTGMFSYSLYLIHAPIIALVRMQLVSLKLSPTVTYGLLFLFGNLFSIALAYAFFLLVERRFIKAPSKTS